MFKKAKLRLNDERLSIPLGSNVAGLEKYLGLDELLEDRDFT